MNLRLIEFDELPGDNRRQNLACDVSSAKHKAWGTCAAGNEMPAVAEEGVQGREGERSAAEYNSEVIFPIKSQLQRVTIMHRNDWEGV